MNQDDTKTPTTDTAAIDTNTSRIQRPILKETPKLSKPTLPTNETENIPVAPKLSLGGKPKVAQSSDTVTLKVVKNAHLNSKTVKLQKTPTGEHAEKLNQPAPSNPAAGTAKIGESTAAPVAAPTSVNSKQTVKLKSPAGATVNNDKTVKIKPPTAAKPVVKPAAPRQDKTVVMKPIPDAATQSEKTSPSYAPMSPMDDEAAEPGLIMSLSNIACVAMAAFTLYKVIESTNLLELL